MKKVLFLFSVCLSIAPQIARADMYKALADVYYGNPAMTSQRENLKAAETRIDQAYSGWKPNVSLNGGIGYTDGKFNKEDFNSKPRHATAEIRQNLFEGFKTESQIKSAKFQVEAERSRLYEVEQNTFLQAINAYVNVLSAKDVLTLQKKNQYVLAKHYEEYKQKFSVGVLKKTDVAQAEARLERAKSEVIDAEAHYQNMLESFRNVYGYILENYTPVNLVGTEPLMPASLEDAEEIALSRHPAILLANSMKKAADENISVAKGGLWPSLDLKLSATRQKEQLGYEDLKDVEAGLYLNIPLYDQGMSRAKTSEAKYTAAYYGQQIDLTRRNVTEILRQAWNDLNAKRAAIRSANIRIKANALALDGVKAEQERGSRTVLDVLDAEQELLDSRVALTQAKHGEISAYFEVISSVGNLTAENLKVLKESIGKKPAYVSG